MPFDGRQRAAVLDRCWSIYLSLTRAFNVPENFHVEFPATVESALVSGALHFTVAVGGDITLTLREEYVFNPDFAVYTGRRRERGIKLEWRRHPTL